MNIADGHTGPADDTDGLRLRSFARSPCVHRVADRLDAQPCFRCVFAIQSSACLDPEMHSVIGALAQLDGRFWPYWVSSHT